MRIGCFLLIVGALALLSRVAQGYTEMDINGVWDWSCSPCAGFQSCSSETVYIGTTATYTTLATCDDNFGGKLAAGQSGNYVIDGNFLHRTVTSYFPTEYHGTSITAPPGGTFTIVSVSSQQIQLVDNLSGEQLTLTCVSDCPGGTNMPIDSNPVTIPPVTAAPVTTNPATTASPGVTPMPGLIIPGVNGAYTKTFSLLCMNVTIFALISMIMLG